MRVIYGEDASAHIKAAVCKVHPMFRGGLWGLSENHCSRNDSPITIPRFHWPARSREGAGSMGRDGPEDRSCLGNASSGDARRAAPTGDRGPQPPARFGDFSAVKSPPPEANKFALPCAPAANAPGRK